MIIVCVGLHIDAEGKLLVQERPKHTKRGGLWEFPGGKVEKGETMRKALAREWWEELGLAIEARELITECVIEFPDSGIVLLPLFRVRYVERPVNEPAPEPQPREGQKIARLSFDEVMELPGVPSMAAYAPDVGSYIARMS